MGLDATVRCRCFEEGKLRAGPVPIEDLYIDDDGHLASRKLDNAHQRYDYRRYQARYGRLNDKFHEWLQTCCEHEYGEICDERVGNWFECAQFRRLVEMTGGHEMFPLLSELLPNGNGGIYPAEKAQAALDELAAFVEAIVAVEQWALIDCDTDEELWATYDDRCVFREDANGRIGLANGRAFFDCPNRPYLESAHFKQTPISEPRAGGGQRVEVRCLETGAAVRIFDAIGSAEAARSEREFRVVRKKAPFLIEGKYWTAERIKNLLVASAETGNPIRWC